MGTELATPQRHHSLLFPEPTVTVRLVSELKLATWNKNHEIATQLNAVKKRVRTHEVSSDLTEIVVGVTMVGCQLVSSESAGDLRISPVQYNEILAG